MREKKSYRLRDILIAEYEGNVLEWAVHHDFGVQRSGSCFIAGDVLVLREPGHEEIGYLYGEFFERLAALPPWDRTRYHCLEENLIPHGRGRRAADPVHPAPMPEPGDYRLGNYRISVDPQGNVTWKRRRGRKVILSGPGLATEHILFLLPARSEESQEVPPFEITNQSLPRWPGPSRYAPHDAVKTCKETAPAVFIREAVAVPAPATEAAPAPRQIQGAGGSGKGARRRPAPPDPAPARIRAHTPPRTGSPQPAPPGFPKNSPRIRPSGIIAVALILISTITGLGLLTHHLTDHRSFWSISDHHHSNHHGRHGRR